MPLNPLPVDAALVDPSGRPTPLFVQRWSELVRMVNALEALGGVTGEYDTETHYLRLTLTNGRVTEIEQEDVPP